MAEIDQNQFNETVVHTESPTVQMKNPSPGMPFAIVAFVMSILAFVNKVAMVVFFPIILELETGYLTNKYENSYTHVIVDTTVADGLAGFTTLIANILGVLGLVFAITGFIVFLAKKTNLPKRHVALVFSIIAFVLSGIALLLN